MEKNLILIKNEDKTVAVVSNNNSATLNVLEKLKKYNVDFIELYLGNKQNRTEFFESQNVKNTNISSYKLDNEKFQQKKDNFLFAKVMDDKEIYFRKILE